MPALRLKVLKRGGAGNGSNERNKACLAHLCISGTAWSHIHRRLSITTYRVDKKYRHFKNEDINQGPPFISECLI
jgi:hypothetical protein